MGFHFIRQWVEEVHDRLVVLKKYTEEPGITEIVIPDGVEMIGEWAFEDCKQIISVIMPESLMIVGRFAFCNCSGLKSVTFPSGLQSISWGAFVNCVSLTSVVIPEGISYLEDDVFQCCTSLSSVTLPDSLEMIEDGAFYGCTALTSLRIPETVREIKDDAFKGCTGLFVLEIPEHLKYFGKYVFGGVQHLLYRGMLLEARPGDSWCDLDWMLYMAMSILKDGEKDHWYEDIFYVYSLALNPWHSVLLAYLKGHFDKMLRIAIQDGHIRAAEVILYHGASLLNADNIDGFLEYAITQKQHDIQLLLMQYKHERIGYGKNNLFLL